MEKVMFIEIGMGIDLHGQDVTVAATRACRDAIGHNSMPGITDVLPGNNRNNMQIRATLGIPSHLDDLNVAAVRAVFPYGQVEIVPVAGGLVAGSGVVLPEKGDSSDEMLIVIAVVEVGY